MIGEAFALFSAACFGLAGAAIARGAPDARGDNGAFLSIVLTALLSGLLWLGMGTHLPWPPDDPAVLMAMGYFVLAGVLSTVLGRLAMFRSVALAGAISASLFRRLIPVFAGALAFVVLGETVGAIEAAGMVVVLGSIALVMSEGWRRGRERRPGTDAEDLPGKRLGQGYGAASAAFYGGAYVTRKLAMRHVPDAALGALVGAITGIVWYLLAATVSRRYRASVLGLVSTTSRWQFVAALSMALGQTSQFFALANTDVATVAIIGSTEVFISTYLAAFVLRTERRPSLLVVIASLIATFGVVLVAVG